MTLESKQQTWTKQCLPERYLCVGCHFNSDQAHRSFCLKRHVRARASTLWRHRWQEATEFLCTITHFLGGSWATKKMAQNPRKCCLRRAANITISKFRGWRRKKKPRASRGFGNLRAVWIDPLIRGQRFWEVILFTGAGCMFAASRSRRVWITTNELFRFRRNKFDKMPCKLHSTEKPHPFENTQPLLKQWVNLNLSKPKSKRSRVLNVIIDFRALLLIWYKIPGWLVFRTCFALAIYVRLHRTCENSRRNTRR